ncbi:unnamed protein product [Ceutorhynchus assimilis]|uniref:Uncharacterized protein n=1 Tax=Ceutorhynchus assimilis TaxID=467358 RepID=A0A9N9QQ91_9CUCU|nr:unnamed protein product [Ceutorhynchus assimilis]
MSSDPSGVYFICRSTIEEGKITIVKRRDIQTLIEVNEKRELIQNKQFLSNFNEVTVHDVCRKRHWTENWHKERKSNPSEERLRVLKAAAQIILEDIRSQTYEITQYPPSDDFLKDADDCVPESLKMFLKTIMLKYKCVSLDAWKKKCTMSEEDEEYYDSIDDTELEQCRSFCNAKFQDGDSDVDENDCATKINELIPFYEGNVGKSEIESIKSNSMTTFKNVKLKRKVPKMSLACQRNNSSRSYLTMFYAKNAQQPARPSLTDTGRATCSAISPKSNLSYHHEQEHLNEEGFYLQMEQLRKRQDYGKTVSEKNRIKIMENRVVRQLKQEIRESQKLSKNV